MDTTVNNCFLWFICVSLIWTKYPTFAQSTQSCSSNEWTDVDDYFNAWSQETESDKMYPFGDSFCDILEQGDSIIDGIPFVAPFYGGRYEQANIFVDGFISFGPRVLADFKSRQTWPNTAYTSTNTEKDPPMIAVYYNDAETPESSGINTAALLYRIVDPSQHTGILSEINSRLLQGFFNDTTAAIPSDTFYPTRALIVTWYRLLFDNYACPIAECPVNTYQAVVLTDDVKTYTILNYNEVNWIGGADDDANCGDATPCDQCNPTQGTNIGYDDCFLAQMGFNRGMGLEFTPLPLSSDAYQLEIDTSSGTPSVLGRYVYEVSGTTIVRGGCANGDLISGSPAWQMTVSPSSGIVLGGYEVSVNSVCLDPEAIVICSFGSQNVTATTVDEYGAVCVAPLLTQTGNVRVSMSIGGVALASAGEIYVDPTQPSQPEVLLVNSYNWFSPDAENLGLTWDPLLFDAESPSSIIIDVSLFGYRETVTNGITSNEWTLLTVLVRDVPNSGSWSFAPADHRCNNTQDCEWYMGALKLSVANGTDNPAAVGGIWTEIMPLGWYVTGVLTELYGSNWPTNMCGRWVSAGQVSAAGPSACPCSPAQAAVDVGRFRHEAACGNGELTCAQSLSNCYVSVQPSASGAASRCCYDDEGILLYAGDSLNASYSSAVHIDGAAPFGPGLTPLMSHWFADVVPYYWCCAWTDSITTCRNNYANRRQTPDCDSYQPPSIAGTYGDPHMLTLDGLQYTFNGEGEFWMVKTTSLQPAVENINIQGRMQSMTTNQASVLTAVAIQEGLTPDGNNTKVHVQLATSNTQNALTVFVDGTTVDFADPLSPSKEFYNVAGDRRTVLTTPNSTSVSSVDIQMAGGVGLTVIAINQTLAIGVSLPEQYNSATSGLMGIRNGLIEDDLTNSTGFVTPINSSTETIHNDFGLSWMTQETESRFTYVGAMDWTYFNNPSFEPTFEPNITASPLTEDEVLGVCGSLTSPCAFDYVVTEDQYFAADTLNQEETLLSAFASATLVLVCPRLDAPNSFKTVVGGYRPGSVVTFTGCEEGYEPKGNERYECLGNGQWNEYFDFQCSDDDDLVLILAIVIPIVVLLLIVVIIALVYMQKRNKKNERPPPRDPVPAVSSPVSMTQPNSYLYNSPGMTDLSRSTSTVNGESGFHTLQSRNSVVLTQTLTSARPPRPQSRMHSSSLSSNSYAAAPGADRASINSSHPSHYSHHSGLVPAYDNGTYQMDGNDDVIDTRIRVPDVLNKPPQPVSDQPPPTSRPKEYYDNLASIPDMDSSSSDSDNEGRRGPPTKTPPPAPRPLTTHNPYAQPQPAYQPRPYSYAAARPYTYTSEYAKPNKGGGVSSSFV